MHLSISNSNNGSIHLLIHCGSQLVAPSPSRAGLWTGSGSDQQTVELQQPILQGLQHPITIGRS